MTEREEFKEFKYFDEDFRHHFRILRNAYPNVFSVLEYELRKMHAGRYNEMKLEKVARRFGAKKLFKDRIRSHMNNRVFEAISKKSTIENASYICQINKFPHISKLISETLTPNQAREAEKRAIRLHALYRQRLAATGIVGRLFRFAVNLNKRDITGSHNFLQNEEKRIRDFISIISQWISQNNILFIIAQGDYMAHQRILVSACRRSSVPFMVIAHGYIQDPKLVPIAPVQGHVLFVWSEEQRKALVRAGIPEETVAFVGNPQANLVIDAPKKDTALICWHPLGSIKSDAEEINDINLIVDKLCAHIAVKFRPHPKDYDRFSTTDISNSINTSISMNNFYQDLASAQAVVGTTSSTLIEAVSNRRSTTQIEGYASVGFEKIKTKRAADLEFSDIIRADEVSEDLTKPFNALAAINRAFL